MMLLKLHILGAGNVPSGFIDAFLGGGVLLSFPMKNRTALAKYGINMISAARSKSASTATHAITAPIPRVPTSPGKTRDGYQLKYRKETRVPMNGIKTT